MLLAQYVFFPGIYPLLCSFFDSFSWSCQYQGSVNSFSNSPAWCVFCTIVVGASTVEF